MLHGAAHTMMAALAETNAAAQVSAAGHQCMFLPGLTARPLSAASEPCPSAPS